MTKNLSKRIFTSIILFSILLIGLFLNEYTWLILLIIASILSFFEFNKLVNKIWEKKEYYKYFFKIVVFFYLFLFIFSGNLIYKQGLELTLLILLICIFSDIGGYIIGKTIGGKKLTKISPNKTISGSMGSFLFSLFPLLLIYKNNLFLDLDFSSYNILFSLIVSLSCQLGDLIISYFKRLNKIKDTGKILPGHGGLLDRIDGIIFAIPSSLLLLTFWHY